MSLVKINKILLGLILTAFCIFSSATYASVSVTPYVGTTFIGGFLVGAQADLDTRVTYQLMGKDFILKAFADLNYVRTSITDEVPFKGEAAGKLSTNIKQNYVSFIGGIKNELELTKEFKPYTGVGLGYSRVNTNLTHTQNLANTPAEEYNSDHSAGTLFFAINGGVTYQFQPNLAVQAELRTAITTTDPFKAYLFSGLAGQLFVGLNYSF